MRTNNIRKIITDLVGKNELGKALKFLKDFCQENRRKKSEDECTVLLARLSKLTEGIRMGTIREEDSRIENANIAKSILGILAILENEQSKLDLIHENFAEFGEKRTELIGLFAKYVYQNYNLAIIRQLGGFSSFSIPNRGIHEKIWEQRKGNQSRSKEYQELQILERQWLERNVKKSYAKLIVNPTLVLEQRGDSATATRIKTLIQFIVSNKNIVDIITDDTLDNFNLLIVGDYFFSESKGGSSLKGYTDTEFHWEEKMVQERIHYFDKLFDQLLIENNLDSYSATEKSISDLHEALANLTTSSKYYPISNNLELKIDSKIEDLLKYIQFDAVAINLDDKSYDQLPQKLLQIRQIEKKPINKDLVLSILPSFPIHKNPLAITSNKAILSRNQYKLLIEYVCKGEYYRESFNNTDNIEYILAFSFGVNITVNAELAKAALEMNDKSALTIIAQSEIHDYLSVHDHFPQTFSIKKEPGSPYLSSEDVVHKAKEIIGGKTNKIGIIANSWHAPRCIHLCENSGFEVVAGIFVDAFSKDDPQFWVRDVLSWIIKESQKPPIL